MISRVNNSGYEHHYFDSELSDYISIPLSNEDLIVSFSNTDSDANNFRFRKFPINTFRSFNEE